MTFPLPPFPPDISTWHIQTWGHPLRECPGSSCEGFRELLAAEQPPPEPGKGDIWKLVIADMEERRQTGIKRYGTPLQAHNGRDALLDAYQEALDLCVYIRQAIEERDDPDR